MSTAAKASGARYVIAVAGATGNIGFPLTSLLVKEYKGTLLTRIIAIVRNPSSERAQALAKAGAEVVQVDEAQPAERFEVALKGVDIFVDALNSGASNEFRGAMVDAIFRNHIKVFFPCEWGFDCRNDHWAWEWPVRVGKVAFNTEVRGRAAKEDNTLKVIEVAPGYFLDMVFPSPYFGFDNVNSVYTVYGSTKQRLSFTHEDDIARSVVELSCLALDPATASSIPDLVRIAGDTVSVEEAAHIVETARGDGRQIELKSEDLDAHKVAVQNGLLAMGARDHVAIARYLRVCNAEGQADLSENSQNELVNPGQSIFRWKTVEDYVQEKRL